MTRDAAVSVWDGWRSIRDPPLHFEEIEKDYLKALSINPYTLNVWILLGRTYENVGKRDSALSAYEHALQLDSANNELIQHIAELKSISHK